MASRRVLVIEDNVDSASAIQLLVRQWGHDCRSSYDGMGGLLLASSYQPQVIILDLMLPLIDGWEVARRLRTIAGLAGAVVIVVTGVTEPEGKLTAWESGVDYCLSKPVSSSKLRYLVENGVRTASVTDFSIPQELLRNIEGEPSV